MAATDRVWMTNVEQVLTNVQGNTYPIGPVWDVGDWSEMFVEIQTVLSDAEADTEIKWYVESAVATGVASLWEKCFPEANLPHTTSYRSVARTNEGGLRRWARVVLYQNGTTQRTVKVNVIALLKKSAG
jgi:hypothetical protein